ncbi:GDP-L-fucose synthase [Loktanella sp. D2R18]|uniref:GDP-L-fucose synthase family protein n=1 Tax=Rhodobacterales TaxID=204455 RepID=UPI000DE8C19B|nr:MULTISPECIES: GDP-L-fucose synthase [Rhodobacterales]MDO6591261.1 GDP-L-fucose synthase [Yoonia sp. 1_MG-2023]RBW46216.1 GDP-L-fucose synthase [Loktanella sp. D2R18]
MRIYVAGHNGMVGSAILRQLAQTDHEILTAPRAQVDLTNQSAVRDFLRQERPDAVILAAARVGGIMANANYPAPFIYDNLMIAANVIHQSHNAGTDRLLFLGSSCIYPRDAAQPLREFALLTGPLEPTNEPYAIAKIAGIKLCESYNRQYGTDYRSIMPTNLYGPGDNFHPENAHVLPALINRFHAATQAGDDTVTVWGSGTPRREFLHVDDLAMAALFVLELDKAHYTAATSPMQSHINVGTGTDITIAELAAMIAEITGFSGTITFDRSKPDGTPRKLLNVQTMADLGWRAKINLRTGITDTYQWLNARRTDERAQPRLRKVT